MNGINLFEQQALALRQIPHETPLANALRFIECANLKQCGKVARQLAARLSTLEQRHDGMTAANLEEAAQFAADAALDIDGALESARGTPCSCGGCDACSAARSDVYHDRRNDGMLALK